MNERIQELLVEAHKQTKGGIYSGHLSELTEKFAELIVRECIKQIAMSSVCFTADQVRIKNMATNCIKEHFGVEE